MSGRKGKTSLVKVIFLDDTVQVFQVPVCKMFLFGLIYIHNRLSQNGFALFIIGNRLAIVKTVEVLFVNYSIRRSEKGCNTQRSVLLRNN